MNELIFIVEDDDNIRELVSVALSAHSYRVKSFVCAEDALEEIKCELPVLIILDIMLPGIDGITALKRIRLSDNAKDVLVMMLTAKTTELDKVIGLESGADDYVAKPFGVMELSARVKALLRRRIVSTDNQTIISSPSILINTSLREVQLKGQKILLTLKEYELLKLLMENRDRVMTREELLDKVWGFDFVSESRTLDMHIRTLRQKLGDEAEKPSYIKTMRGVGYRFVD